MLYALLDNKKSLAIPKSEGLCLLCNSKVISKCGDQNVWHWAHAIMQNCDNWHEGETEWHKNWKFAFGEQYVEIIISQKDKKHIADILTKDELVIELQNSPINVQTIIDREKFYGKKMLWILNGVEFRSNFYFYPSGFFVKKKASWLGAHYKKYRDPTQIENDLIKNFMWTYPRKCWSVAERPVFIDFGEDTLFWFQSGVGTKRGNGRIVSKETFLKKYGGDVKLLQSLISVYEKIN